MIGVADVQYDGAAFIHTDTDKDWREYLEKQTWVEWFNYCPLCGEKLEERV
jgi:hypothetical protein